MDSFGTLITAFGLLFDIVGAVFLARDALIYVPFFGKILVKGVYKISFLVVGIKHPLKLNWNQIDSILNEGDLIETVQGPDLSKLRRFVGAFGAFLLLLGFILQFIGTLL